MFKDRVRYEKPSGLAGLLGQANPNPNPNPQLDSQVY